MKALIPAAGYGTRFYPVAKSIPKEMLPVGAKPAIQLIVEEALAAGADEVIIVTSPDKPSLEQYFTPKAGLAGRLAAKPAAAAAIRELDEVSKSVRFIFQREQRGLGHAVLQAAPLFAGEREPVLILLGDAVVKSERPCACDLIEVSRRFGGASVVGLERVPREKLSRYGIVSGTMLEGDRLLKLAGLVEKPAPEQAPSDLAIAGRYLLDPAIFEVLGDCPPSSGGEIQLTDAIARLLERRHPVYGYRYPGRRFDIGNPAGYLETLNAYASRG